ncbi:MAG: hypothetical protein AAGI45_12095 [Cyanobacteria bacterium P01_H01_bin.26]
MSDLPDHQTNPAANDADSQPKAAKPEENEVTQLVERLIRAKTISYPQYQTLSKMVLADGTVDEQERRQINRLFDAIQSGAIRIVE